MNVLEEQEDDEASACSSSSASVPFIPDDDLICQRIAQGVRVADCGFVPYNSYMRERERF